DRDGRPRTPTQSCRLHGVRRSRSLPADTVYLVSGNWVSHFNTKVQRGFVSNWGCAASRALREAACRTADTPLHYALRRSPRVSRSLDLGFHRSSNGTLDRDTSPPNYGACNNYRVKCTRLCLFCHT